MDCNVTITNPWFFYIPVQAVPDWWLILEIRFKNGTVWLFMFFLAGFKYAACRIATILFLVIPVSFKAGTARTVMTISLTRAAVTMAVISTAGALPAAGLDAQWLLP